MNRRRMLGAVAGSVVALSGCLGYSIENAADVQRRETQITDLESELEQQSAEVSRLEENNQVLRDTVNQEEKKQIVARYRDGIAIQNEANTRWNEAQQAFGDRQYAAARRRFFTIAGYWGSAAVAFRNAANAAEGLGENSTEQACTAARNHCALMVNASNHWGTGANHYANGDPVAGNDAIDRARAALADADSFNVASLSEIRSRLGLA